MDNKEKITLMLLGRVAKISELSSDHSLAGSLAEAADLIAVCFRDGGKLLICGNGGSAADAQHLAAEFSGKFYLDREPLNAEALHVNTSYLTAVSNDYSFDEVYSRLIRGKGKAGEIVLALDCDILLNVPSDDTPQVQELHITLGHILCQLVEEMLFADGN